MVRTSGLKGLEDRSLRVCDANPNRPLARRIQNRAEQDRMNRMNICQKKEEKIDRLAPEGVQQQERERE